MIFLNKAIKLECIGILYMYIVVFRTKESKFLLKTNERFFLRAQRRIQDIFNDFTTRNSIIKECIGMLYMFVGVFGPKEFEFLLKTDIWVFFRV